MSDDLRTGLVEAMTRAFIDAAMAVEGPLQGLPLAESELKRIWLSMPAAVDRGLGFLTDNWPKTGNDIEDALMLRVGRSSDRTIETCITTFLAALSDGRDTGEKP